MQLRRIEERDLDAVRRLRNVNRQWFFFDGEVTTEQHRSWFAALDEGPMRFYVMEEQGEIVGTVSVKDTPEGTEFGNLIVDDRYRGQGFALQALSELTSESGTYFSNILPDNAASIAALQRVGFTLEHVVLVKRV
jgi:RimJ/RimL family protein N-acetyltransferase